MGVSDCMLERYGHGGDLTTAEEAFGKKAEDFIDFSSNMNPLGPPDVVRTSLVTYADRIAQYPDPAVRGLRSILAKKHGIAEDAIVVGNGAAELIDLIVRVIQPKTTALAVPCFDEYGDAVRKIGGAIYEIELSGNNGFVLDAEHSQLDEARERATLFMLGSPNNPTGQLVDPELLAALAESGAYVVVDEAFMDFVPEEASFSLVQAAAKHERLFVVRSMTKFYSIPGVRLGYIVGSPRLLGQLRRLQVPWSVNSLAQLIGEAVVGDEPFAERTMNWLGIERAWLKGQLELLGLKVFDSKVNYLLVKLSLEHRLSASMLQLEMGKQGVLIRDASRFAGLDHTYIRVAVKLREHNERLVDALAICLKGLEARG